MQLPAFAARPEAALQYVEHLAVAVATGKGDEVREAHGPARLGRRQRPLPPHAQPLQQLRLLGHQQPCSDMWCRSASVANNDKLRS